VRPRYSRLVVRRNSRAFFPPLIIIDYCPWEYCILVLSVQMGNVAYCFMSDVNVNGFYTILGYSLPKCDLQLMYGA